MGRWFAALVFLVFAAVGAAAQIGPVDKSDGCGRERMSVAMGRDSIRRDRFYKETDLWFRERVQALEKCVADVPARIARDAASAAALKARQAQQKLAAEKGAAAATTNVLLVFLVALPIAIILSYAQSAGIAGNAAWVRLGDWKGSAMYIWGAVAAGTLGWYFMSHAMLDGELGSAHSTRSVLTVLAGLAVFLVAMLSVVALTFQFVVKDLWVTTKGLVMLAHYVFVRHPAHAYLPIDPTSPLARRDFGRAIRGHRIDLKGFWRELVTPDFVRRHQLERASQVEAQLKADTSILKAAMERESTRAAHQDQGDNV